jgi:hypothetical protein
LLGRAPRACCAEAGNLMMAPMGADGVEQALFEVFVAEWRLQRGDAGLHFVAIVDETPEQQYLCAEFLLFRQLLKRRGIEATGIGTTGTTGVAATTGTAVTTGAALTTGAAATTGVGRTGGGDPARPRAR